jgi:flagellar motor switch protein FliM
VSLLTREVEAVEVTVVAELAKTRTTVEQLLEMKPGDFIELDRQSSIQATVDGVPLFECQYGTHNAKYAIRIDKNLRALDQGWTGE